MCFNTVALLFVCHIDRLVYYNMLPEHQKIRANEDRVVLGVKEEQALSVAKRTHVMVLTVMIPFIVAYGSVGVEENFGFGVGFPLLAFLLAGAVESIYAAPLDKICSTMLMSLVKWTLGLIGIVTLGELEKVLHGNPRHPVLG